MKYSVSKPLIAIYDGTIKHCADIPAPASFKLTWGREWQKPFNNDKKGNIIVVPLDTVSTLLKYSDKKVAILNMASAKNKGGGVLNGAVSQEECLFHCSNLFQIPDGFYPVALNEFIYTKDVSFVRDVYYNFMNHIKADVITMPALNLNNNHDFKTIGLSYEQICLNKINAMLRAALEYGCDNIILGAWGCGVYKNDPNVISKYFKLMLHKNNIFKNFENVVFAIINDKNSVGQNFEIFNSLLK